MLGCCRAGPICGELVCDRPRDGHRAGVRWCGAGMSFHPTIGSLTRRDKNGGLPMRCCVASRQPYRQLLDIAPKPWASRGAAGESAKHGTANSLVATSPQKGRAVAAPQKTRFPRGHRHSLGIATPTITRAASSNRCSDEHPTATSHQRPRGMYHRLLLCNTITGSRRSSSLAYSDAVRGRVCIGRPDHHRRTSPRTT